MTSTLSARPADLARARAAMSEAIFAWTRFSSSACSGSTSSAGIVSKIPSTAGSMSARGSPRATSSDSVDAFRASMVMHALRSFSQAVPGHLSQSTCEL
eukprot:scaffold66899_cov64-Phaeocystis_antarctica.AAC.8